MEEENFDKSKEEIKSLYKDLESVAEMNPELYVISKALYNQIIRKVGHMDDRIRKQTASLKMHLSEKQKLRRKIKELE